MEYIHSIWNPYGMWGDGKVNEDPTNSMRSPPCPPLPLTLGYIFLQISIHLPTKVGVEPRYVQAEVNFLKNGYIHRPISLKLWVRATIACVSFPVGAYRYLAIGISGKTQYP